MTDFYKPTLQTKFNEEGNCLAASLATIYGVNIKDVPFFDDENWVFDLSVWLGKTLGKFVVPVKLADKRDYEVFCDSLVITSINSDNPKVKRHVVITKNGRIVFDPMIGEVDRPLLQKMEPTYLIVGDIVERKKASARTTVL